MIFITILLAILIFALLILVHELGHMIAAKLSGVEVVEFALGLGPALFKKKLGETTYAIRALPFGGQCVMRGEDDDNGEFDSDPRSFNNAKSWKKLIILSAGAIMNFIMGYIIFVFLFVPAKAYIIPEIDSLMPQFTGGGENGIMPNDTILEIDGFNIYISSDISTALSRGQNAPYYDVTVRRGNSKIELNNVEIAPKPYDEDGKTVYYYGFRFKTKAMTFIENLKLSWYNSVNMVRLVLLSLSDMFRGAIKVSEMQGVVGISAMMSDTAKQSLPEFWYLSALIAINLAVMNMLPFPALDGGRIVFIIYEMIFKKPVNRKVETYIHVAGLLFLLALMAYVTFNDIWRLIFK